MIYLGIAPPGVTARRRPPSASSYQDGTARVGRWGAAFLRRRTWRSSGLQCNRCRLEIAARHRAAGLHYTCLTFAARFGSMASMGGAYRFGNTTNGGGYLAGQTLGQSPNFPANGAGKSRLSRVCGVPPYLTNASPRGCCPGTGMVRITVFVLGLIWEMELEPRLVTKT